MRKEPGRTENVESLAGALGEVRSLTTAGGGTALTTTAAFIPITLNARHLILIPRNFAAGAVVAQVALNPFLSVIKTTDDLASYTDYSDAAQDGSAATDVVLSSLSTYANKDYLLVGASVPFRGVNIDVDAVNGNASVLTVKYYTTALAWADITATDGTTNAGATMAIDGNVTWAVPTDWQKLAIAGKDLYWTRWEVSAALDGSTTLNAMLAMNRSTAYQEIPSGIVVEQRIYKGTYGVGCIEALVDAGTGNLIANAASGDGRVF